MPIPAGELNPIASSSEVLPPADVVGVSTDSTGVRGVSTSGSGVQGFSTSGAGVYAQSQTGVAIHGKGTNAGQFEGAVSVSGSLSANGGLAVKGSLSGDPSAGGALSVSGTINAGADVAVTGVLSVSGNINAGGNVAVTGDVTFAGSDCAEEVDAGLEVEPGSVVIVEKTGRLRECYSAYDKRVVGVISGAGTLKPAIILGRDDGSSHKAPLALSGRVFCKVDAQYSPIEVGDLLTTSSTPGHAMRAADPACAFGCVIGKALAALETGRGYIPVLVSLQ